MDRFRKTVEKFRLRVRSFINRNWHNDPEGGRFRSLDILYILGAVRYKPTHRWQHICWNTYRVVAFCSFAIFVLNAMDVASQTFNLVKATWHAVTVSTAILCFGKNIALNQNFESIHIARNFINSKPFGSGDADNDSACRKKVFQRLQLTFSILLAVMLMDLMIVQLPYFSIDEFIGTPQLLHRLGPAIASGIHFLFIFTAFPIWFNQYFSGTGTVCSLLYGFKMEYEIFAGGFENILDNVYCAVENKLPDDLEAAPERKWLQRDKLFWKFLKHHVNNQVKLHIQLVEYEYRRKCRLMLGCLSVSDSLLNLQLLEPIVKILFAMMYYNAMVLFSPYIYIMLFHGVSVTSLFMASGIAMNLVECFVLSSIIESFQDINETLEVEIMDLMTNIPHSQLHHKKYADTRLTLFIMKTFVRNHEPFSCGGVFPINVEAFRDLLDIGYTVVTFLMDMGKKM